MKVTLTTTLKASDWQKHKNSLLSWQNSLLININILIHETEIISLRADCSIEQLLPSIRFIPYSTPSLATLENNTQSSPPSLTQIFNLMKYSEHSEVYGFFNADIYLSPSCTDQFTSILAKAKESSRLYLIHRTDYCQDTKTRLGPYIQGFDMFLLNSELLTHINPDSYREFLIGQVGWDYALPLLLDRKLVRVALDSPIFHDIHQTGSSLSWSSQMNLIYGRISGSWIHELPAPKQICYLLIKPTKIDRLLSYITTQAVSQYLLSRIRFYFFMQPMLRSIEPSVSKNDASSKT